MWWFILVGLTILFGGHYLLYRTLVRFFGLDNASFRAALLAVFFLLASSFFVAEILAHFYQGLITRVFYLFSSVWLGLFINGLLAAGLLWAVVLAVKLVPVEINGRWLAAIIFSLAILWSVFGIWNAFNPGVKSIEVAIKDLPPQWQNKTIVQLSDVHLGLVYGPDFLQKLVDRTNALEPALILITGDLFDGADGNLGNFVAPLNGFQAANGVRFVTGNHETYLGVQKAFDVLRKTQIQILDDELVDVNGLQIVGISYPAMEQEGGVMGGSKNTTDIINSLKGYDKTKPTILMHHAPTNIEQAKASGVDLQLSGHAHRGQFWPFGLITRAIFGQYHYGLHSDGDFSIYTSCGVGTWGPPMRTSGRSEIVVIKLKKL